MTKKYSKLTSAEQELANILFTIDRVSYNLREYGLEYRNSYIKDLEVAIKILKEV